MSERHERRSQTIEKTFWHRGKRRSEDRRDHISSHLSVLPFHLFSLLVLWAKRKKNRDKRENASLFNRFLSLSCQAILVKERNCYGFFHSFLFQQWSWWWSYTSVSKSHCPSWIHSSFIRENEDNITFVLLMQYCFTQHCPKSSWEGIIECCIMVVLLNQEKKGMRWGGGNWNKICFPILLLIVSLMHSRCFFL